MLQSPNPWNLTLWLYLLEIGVSKEAVKLNEVMRVTLIQYDLVSI